ncbi:hypothetical protein FKM82_023653 [Ascaphus truei]
MSIPSRQEVREWDWRCQVSPRHVVAVSRVPSLTPVLSVSDQIQKSPGLATAKCVDHRHDQDSTGYKMLLLETTSEICHKTVPHALVLNALSGESCPLVYPELPRRQLPTPPPHLRASGKERSLSPAWPANTAILTPGSHVTFAPDTARQHILWEDSSFLPSPTHHPARRASGGSPPNVSALQLVDAFLYSAQ